jgi:hypothetical protein
LGGPKVEEDFHSHTLQSNLCTITILGTPKKWPLLRGWSKIVGKFIVGHVIQAGHRRQMVVVQKWSLAKV